MDFSKESWRAEINNRTTAVVSWLKKQGHKRDENSRFSAAIAKLPLEEQKILYARMMIEVPEKEN